MVDMMGMKRCILNFAEWRVAWRRHRTTETTRIARRRRPTEAVRNQSELAHQRVEMSPAWPAESRVGTCWVASDRLRFPSASSPGTVAHMICADATSQADWRDTMAVVRALWPAQRRESISGGAHGGGVGEKLRNRLWHGRGKQGQTDRAGVGGGRSHRRPLIASQRAAFCSSLPLFQPSARRAWATPLPIPSPTPPIAPSPPSTTAAPPAHPPTPASTALSARRRSRSSCPTWRPSHSPPPPLPLPRSLPMEPTAGRPHLSLFPLALPSSRPSAPRTTSRPPHT